MKKNLSISEMAEMHNVSRQTLIYYDKIGLFRPVCIDNNGYRYYSPYQIPFLREICFLKSIGIKLEDIKQHIKNRDINSAISMLECHKEFIDKEINKLLDIREFIEQKLGIFATANQFKDELYKPIIERFPERKVVFFPFEREICKEELHFTLMKAWNTLIKNGMLPSKGFGTIIKKNQTEKKDCVFEGAGVYISLPFTNADIENVITLQEGQYACMYKYGMPYDTEQLFKLLQWIEDNNFKITGDVVDACLLDTTFYQDDKDVDFCQIQIPILTV